HIEKRFSHNFQAGFSYTYSHALDEQSALGLFYNGNNPLNLRDGWGSSDFDRTHVINFNYLLQLPNFKPEASLVGKFVDGWAISGIAVIQSGQTYSVIDYSGAVGSVFYGVSAGITNRIVPLSSSALTSSTSPTRPALISPATTSPKTKTSTVFPRWGSLFTMSPLASASSPRLSAARGRSRWLSA